MRRLLQLGLPLAVALSSCTPTEVESDRDFHVYTGNIITMNPDQPRAGAVIVEDGRIVSVADSYYPLNPNTDTVTDLGDATLMPGLIDPHLHPILAAMLLPMEFITPEDWDLPHGLAKGVRTEAAYRNRLESFVAAQPGDTPLFSWGHHPLFHGALTRADLDTISPDRPLHIWHRSFHEMILNSAALDRLGMGTDAAFRDTMSGIDPTHYDIETGMVHETALAALLPRLAPDILAPTHLAKGFADLRAMLSDNGVTTISDMGTGIVINYQAESKMIALGLAGDPTRYHLVPVIGQEVHRADGDMDAAMNTIATYATDPKMNDRVKLLADGAFFAQYMQMREPYLDGHAGKWLTEPDSLATQAKAAWAAGYTLHIHVNGDAGLDAVLAAVEALPPPRDTDQRLVLEHLGYHAPDQTARLAALAKSHGLAVSAQPNYVHVVADAYAREGLGETRAHHISRLKALTEAGIPVAVHSDLTMAPTDPLFLAWVAATRQTMAGNVVGAADRLSLEDALKAITIDAAYAIGQEDEIGSIAPGKRADFTVLGQDPYVVGAEGLKDIPIRGRIIGGIWVAAGTSD